MIYGGESRIECEIRVLRVKLGSGHCMESQEYYVKILCWECNKALQGKDRHQKEEYVEAS